MMTIVTRDYSPYTPFSSADLNETQVNCLESALLIEARLMQAGFRPFARIAETSDIIDICFKSASGMNALIRCSIASYADSRVAFETMLAEGDFDRAVLVYCDLEHPQVLVDGIECWPMSRIDELATLLAREGATG